MPLGNGHPRGIPSTPLAVYKDVRTYDIAHGSAGDTGFDPLTRPAAGVQLSPYERVIAATPGLAMWWPLCAQGPAPTVALTGYGDAAGATTLVPAGSGTDTLVPGIVPGSRNKAVKLASGRYLIADDYRVWPMADETIMTVEFWVQFQTLGSDSALVGEWDASSNGWMVYSSSGDLRMYCTSNHMDHASSFVVGPTYHVVAVFGGSQSPTSDYVSRAYINGVQAMSGNIVLGSGKTTFTTSARFQVNAYTTDGGGGGHHGMTIQHISIYNRMLQPAEVLQHYQAGFARA